MHSEKEELISSPPPFTVTRLILLGGGDETGIGLEPTGVTLPGLSGNRSSAENAAQFGLSLPTSVLPPVGGNSPQQGQPGEVRPLDWWDDLAR